MALVVSPYSGSAPSPYRSSSLQHNIPTGYWWDLAVRVQQLLSPLRVFGLLNCIGAFVSFYNSVYFLDHMRTHRNSGEGGEHDLGKFFWVPVIRIGGAMGVLVEATASAANTLYIFGLPFARHTVQVFSKMAIVGVALQIVAMALLVWNLHVNNHWLTESKNFLSKKESDPEKAWEAVKIIKLVSAHKDQKNQAYARAWLFMPYTDWQMKVCHKVANADGNNVDIQKLQIRVANWTVKRLREQRLELIIAIAAGIFWAAGAVLLMTGVQGLSPLGWTIFSVACTGSFLGLLYGWYAIWNTWGEFEKIDDALDAIKKGQLPI